VRELEQRFHRHMLADVDYFNCRGYNPIQFLRMITQSGSTARLRCLASTRQPGQPAVIGEPRDCDRRMIVRWLAVLPVKGG
jgi:hypothetical protein